jgi:uncharacterized protein
MPEEAAYWIKRLNMQPHIEGGYYCQAYQSRLRFGADQLPEFFHGERHAATHIYFLLQEGQTSVFHRIKSDELWHFYAGDSLEIFEINLEGILEAHRLGNKNHPGEFPFCYVKAGSWFGACPAKGSIFSLVGCTVSPGFDFDDFELADVRALLDQYPQYRQAILSCNPRANNR